MGALLAALALVFSGHASTPPFQASVTEIPASYRARMTSWHPGCPVPVGSLRLLTVSFWGFDGRVHPGRLIANRDAVPALRAALAGLYDARFPIRRMEPVERYGSDDDRSMAADNTSSFNCRGVPGSTSWSQHAYGRAIDINPLENPEVRDGVVSPPRGRAFVDRGRDTKGMIHPGDAAVAAFARAGWAWGGNWHSLKDYQHFSANGL